MADAYGSIELNVSDNFSGDLDVIYDVLSQYCWANDGDQWGKMQASDGKTISLTFGRCGCVQYPTVYPEEFAYLVVIGEGGVRRKVENPTEEEWNNHEDVFEKPVPLKQLASNLAQGVKCGWIELNATSTEKTRYLNTERLRVSYDGTATRSRVVVGRGYEENLFEEI